MYIIKCFRALVIGKYDIERLSMHREVRLLVYAKFYKSHFSFFI